MPQLVKGGKNVFGWSRIGPGGRIRIPPEAVEEYRLQGEREVFLVSGSKTSGGFGLIEEGVIGSTPLGAFLDGCPTLAGEDGVGRIEEWKGRTYARTRVSGGVLALTAAQCDGYKVGEGCLLLAVRGSGLGPSFLAKGPLLEEARRHPELDLFEPPGSPAGMD